jgi:hypothetical protein
MAESSEGGIHGEQDEEGRDMMQSVSSCVGLLEHQGLMNDRVRPPMAGPVENWCLHVWGT